MVQEGDFIDFASNLSVVGGISTATQICIELAKMVKRTNVYEMKSVSGFTENEYGLLVANNIAGTCVFRISPMIKGIHKFVLGYASTVQPFTFTGDIRIGSWRFNEAFDPTRYLSLTNISISNTQNNIPLQYSTTSFNITTVNEIVITRIRHTAGTEAGNFYMLAGALLRV